MYTTQFIEIFFQKNELWCFCKYRGLVISIALCCCNISCQLTKVIRRRVYLAHVIIVCGSLFWFIWLVRAHFVWWTNVMGTMFYVCNLFHLINIVDRLVYHVHMVKSLNIWYLSGAWRFVKLVSMMTSLRLSRGLCFETYWGVNDNLFHSVSRKN